jgi:single-strand DNA-binding protein
MSDNTITVSGNLTRDPELRFTTGGRGVANLTVAVNHRFMQNNEWQDSVSFVDVTAWGTLGENVAASCGKGDRVVVHGRLEQRQYETKEGEKRSAWSIVADDIAASMKWARTTIERTTRTGGDQPSTSRPTEERRGQHTDPVYGDEEPF